MVVYMGSSVGAFIHERFNVLENIIIYVYSKAVICF